MKVVYIAHAMSAPTDEGMAENRRKAKKWAAWAFGQGMSPMCSWIVLTEEIPETPENRIAGLASDVEQVKRCDELWFVGERISSGMKTEAAAARLIVDFTHLGLALPLDGVTEAHGKILKAATDPEAVTLIPPDPKLPALPWAHWCHPIGAMIHLDSDRAACDRCRVTLEDARKLAVYPVEPDPQTWGPDPFRFVCAPNCNALVCTGTTVTGAPVPHSDFCPLSKLEARNAMPTLPEVPHG